MCLSGGGATQEETAEERQLSEEALRDWNDYKEFYRPIENQHAGELNKMGGKEEIERMRGKATAGLQQGVGTSKTGDIREVATVQRATSEGHAGVVVGSDIATQKRYQAGKEGAIAMGRDIKNVGAKNLLRSANLAFSNAATDAAIANSRSSFDSETIGTAVGLGGYGVYSAWQKQPTPDAGKGGEGSKLHVSKDMLDPEKTNYGVRY